MTFKELVEKVAEFEGFRPVAYKDPAGVLTIGYGRTTDVKAGDTTTEEREKTYLYNTLANIYDSIQKGYACYAFSDNELKALCSFTYNCGFKNLNRLTVGGTRTKEEIAEKILLYTKAGDKTLNGLVKRRQWEHALFTLKEDNKEHRESAIGFRVNNIWYIYTGKSVTINGVDMAVCEDATGIERYVSENNIINGDYPIQFFGI